MRQRITFIHKPEDAVDPASFRIGDREVAGPDIQAVREERFTLGIDELPDEIARLLRSSHELHIRWVSALASDVLDPLSSRLSPGFHVFYTPIQGEAGDLQGLCHDLMKVFGQLQCTEKESFTKLPNDRFSHSAAYHYYQWMRHPSPFMRYVRDKTCNAMEGTKCLWRVRLLDSATSVDFDYDAISHVLKVTALWPHDKYSLSVVSPKGSHRTEIGVLTGDPSAPNLGEHDVGMQGVLTVLGEHTKPSVTMFAFPSRHRHYDAAFSASFLEPTGLHPTLQLKISSSKPPIESSYCAPHAYLTLPKTIFPDRYQLDNALFLASKNLTALRYASEPIDLEAPAYRTSTWGSNVLLEMKAPIEANPDDSWTVEVPLHLRYLEPNAEGVASIEVPYPVVFWACAAEEGTKFPNNPFERVNLGYDALFGPRTVFWHVAPRPEAGKLLANEVKVPVLAVEKGQTWLATGTAVVVLLGFAWVVWSLVASLRGTSLKTRKADEKKKKQ